MQSFSLESSKGTLEGFISSTESKEIQGTLKPFSFDAANKIGVFKIAGVVGSETVHEFMDVALSLGATAVITIAEKDSKFLEELGFIRKQTNNILALWLYQ